MSMIRVFLAVVLLFAGPALAQQPAPSVEELQAQYMFETGQLRQALGQAQAQLIQLRKENAELKAKAEKPPEVKK